MIHNDLTYPSLIQDMEKNFAEEMACHSRSNPLGELHTDGELSWFMTDPHGPNGVLASSFVDASPDDINRKITETIQHFTGRGITHIAWRTSPVTQPTNLETYLLAQGFKRIETFTNMILAASQLQQSGPSPEHLTIHEVATSEDLRQKCAVERVGFGASEEVAERYYQTYAFHGFGTNHAWRHYIARSNDEPVGVASLLLHGGLAGIYGVTTVPEARRQGIGTALTAHTVLAAQKLGYPIGILSNTEMSTNLYQRLGFQDHYQARLYLFSSGQK